MRAKNEHMLLHRNPLAPAVCRWQVFASCNPADPHTAAQIQFLLRASSTRLHNPFLPYTACAPPHRCDA